LSFSKGRVKTLSVTIEYKGLFQIDGPLVVLEGVKGVSFDEIARLTLPDGQQRQGRVVLLDGDRAVLQIFEGTRGLSLSSTRTRFTGRPLEMALSPDMLGRIFSGVGKPIDGLGELFAAERRPVDGFAINPAARMYPRNCIYTGISAIDGMTTLIRGQKLPIFSGAGMSHNLLASQIVRQARLESLNEPFAVVFCAMGTKRDTAQFFKDSFESSGALRRVVMFMNLADDPIVERILAPRCALTAAEYLAFTLDMQVLVIMTDITAYCEALRELSSASGEIPSRKGFPGYMYSDLASLYERAGMIQGRKGSVTLMPILTMPNDDINHPIPDLTGYITEGQIVLDRALESAGIYPPIAVLPSLSRLMKDGIGEGYTRKDHPSLANQLFSLYAKVQDVRSLAAVIGEEDLSPLDAAYLRFGQAFEQRFIAQRSNEARTLENILMTGWELVSMLPKEELDRIDQSLLDAYYRPGAEGGACLWP
jgi:V/A-type H+-transporting ATPase subunit B